MYLQASEGLGQTQIQDSQTAAEWRCPKVEQLKVGTITVWSLPAPFFFKAKMAIDADGAPNAYNPSNTGLDFLKNAGYPPKPGKTAWGIITDKAGNPIIQGKSDPYPGFYVSGTSLGDSAKPLTDPRRYVDSTTIPYIALPEALTAKLRVKLGDFAAVINAKNRRISYAIFADIGGRGKLGEGSIALVQSLGQNPFVGGRAANGIENDVIYVVFPESGNGKPRSLAEIKSEGEKLFKSWGGITRIKACFFPAELIRDLPVPPAGTRYA